jgi:DNA modification methylase
MKIRDRIKEFRRVPASELRPNPANWRTHPEAQQNALRGVLAEVGIAAAVIARELPDGTLELIDGHLRTDVLPGEMIPTLVLDVDEAEAAKLLATFDPLGKMAEADPARLDALLREIDTGSEALQEMLAELAEEAGLCQDESAEIVEDEAPEAPVVPISKEGDLWLLGEHRLLAGDSTKAADVERLMDGEKLDAVITDPPYGIRQDVICKGITGATRANAPVTFKGDTTTETAEHVLAKIDWERPAIVWGANYFPKSFPSGFGWIVWDKVREGETFSGAELAFSNVGVRVDIFRHQWHGMIRASEHGEARVHPTQKPVKLLVYCLERVGEAPLIFDPFIGSGTTLIAAEQLKRRAFGIEISPAYIDVAALRWMRLAGKEAHCERKGKRKKWTAETFEKAQAKLVPA